MMKPSPTFFLLAVLWVAAPAAAPRAADLPPQDAEYLRMYFTEEELVESPTRAPKPLSQVAENVTVVTAQEIEDMNAHTLAEVLDRVTGVFVEFLGPRFGATALPHIQGSGETDIFAKGSNEHYITLLLDGIPWNDLDGSPVLETIPVGAVDRIEIIKGPASSAWGSALGGVINVLTKRAGRTRRPTGALQGSYGELDAWDGRAEAAGALGPAGYYAEAEAKHDDWKGSGGFRSRSALGKAEARLGGKTVFSLTGGYTRPEVNDGHLERYFAFAQERYRTGFGRAGVDVTLVPGLSLHAAGYLRRNRLGQTSQEDGTFAPAGALLQDVTFGEEHSGAQGRVVWAAGRHTLVLGADYHRGELDQTFASGEYYQSTGSPANAEFESTIDHFGVYFNDTVTLEPVTLTPGLRYDDTSLTDPFLSPSLGATWQVTRQTLVRASVARGFTTPPLSYLSGGGVNLDPNPHLEPERVWSYQAGAETTAVPALWLKVTLFHHEVQDSLEAVASPLNEKNITVVNRGWARRTGVEAEAETARWYGVSLRAGFAWVHVDKAAPARTQDQHQTNLVLSYAEGPWRAGLYGHYVWWDLGSGAQEGHHDDGLWDLTASRSFTVGRFGDAEAFAEVHNLFGGDQQFDPARDTEPRWVEGGLRFRF